MLNNLSEENIVKALQTHDHAENELPIIVDDDSIYHLSQSKVSLSHTNNSRQVGFAQPQDINQRIALIVNNQNVTPDILYSSDTYENMNNSSGQNLDPPPPLDHHPDKEHAIQHQQILAGEDRRNFQDFYFAGS